MKRALKSIIFILFLLCLIEILNYILIPKYRFFSSNDYEISSEKDSSIDAIFLGDSLVYSSLSPMTIWNNYGFTTFDCARPAELTEESYEYLKYTLKYQKPKIVFLETNILFRDPKKRTFEMKLASKAKKYISIFTYHDNWKKYLNSGKMDSWINYSKGYKYITKIKPAKSNDYIKYSNRQKPIPKENITYLNKIIDLCSENNIKLIFINFPTQKSFNYKKHNSSIILSKNRNIEYIDLNMINLNINWKTDTKDRGSHLNYLGSEKVSLYIGKYLKNKNLLIDHRGDYRYNDWNKAYKMHLSKNVNN